MSTLSVPALVGRLHDLPLLEAGQRAQLPRLAAGFTEPGPLLQELHRRRWLTSYQIKTLLSGREDPLVLGPYLLLNLLGHGAVGRVYRARRLSDGGTVALKVIPTDALHSQRAVLRFHREAHVTAQLDHPNIVRTLDAGQEGAACFMAMEHVDGIDLSRMVKQNGPLAVPLACDLIRQAALALQYAHDRGLIHRDVKPSNLLVIRSASHPPQSKLLDFGLARILNDAEEQSRLTQVGRLVGTVDFMSPEQAADARGADGRSDLFSLGATLFYTLAGVPPFAGNDLVERLTARMEGEAPPLGQFRDNLPAGLEAVVATMMARDPDQRFPTCRDAAAALAPFCGGQPTLPPPPPVARPQQPPPLPLVRNPLGSRRARRFPVGAMLVMTAVAFALLLAAGVRLASELDRPAKEATPAGKKAGESDRNPRSAAPKRGSGGRPLAHLQAELRSDNAKVRLEAAVALERMSPEDARPALPALLARLAWEPDLPTRRALVRAAATLARPEDGRAVGMLATVADDSDPPTRTAAVQALDRLAPGWGGKRMKLLLGLLREGDDRQRRQAIEALGRMGAKAGDAATALVGPLADAQVGVRRRAATALGRMGPRAAPMVPDLARRLDTDPAGIVRQAAAEALAELGHPTNQAAVPSLVRVVGVDADPAVRQRAVWALAPVPDLPPGAAHVLEKVLETTDPVLLPVRYDAACLLGGRQKAAASDRVFAVLLERVRNRGLKSALPPGTPGGRINQDGRFLAVDPLARTANPKRLPEIRKALEEAARDRNGRLRAAAEKALAGLP